MSFISVITGDVIDSTKLPDNKRSKLPMVLNALVKELNNPGDTFEIYRGDGFQMSTRNTSKALAYCLLFRCALMKSFTHKNKVPVDARISLGIGKENQKGKARVADGEAFLLSGRGLESIATTSRALIIRQDSIIGPSLNIISLYLDEVVKYLSQPQAEVIYYMLLDKKQTEIAKLLGITQSSVSQRLQSAQWNLIDPTLKYFEEEMKKLNSIKQNL